MAKIGIGVIGAGIWGESHARVFSAHPDVRLVAVCDVVPDKAQALAKKYGVAKTFTDYNQMLKDPEVQAVGIVTPDFLHKDPFVAACRAGKSILMEKPLATTYEDLAAMKKAYQESKVRVMVDFHARWNPPLTIAYEDIKTGKLGTLISFYYRLNNPVWVPTRMLSWSKSSSILWFLGSHTVDTLRFLSGSEVRRVYSVSRSEVLVKLGIPVPDIYQSILEFENGVIATIENCWALPNTIPHWNDIKLNVLGTKGMFNMDLTNNQAIERFTEEKADHPDMLIMPVVHGKPIGFAHESIRDFADRLASGKEFLATFEDGYRVSSVLLSIMRSAEKRQPMDVEYR
jgi:predicted dehydrogenase